jgi:hypothetical protein
MKKSHALLAFIGLIVLLTAGAAQGLSGTNTVDSGDIIDGQVKFSDIAANAVTQSRIADNGVSGSEIAANAVAGSEILDESVTNLDIGANVVRASELGTITQRSAVSSTIAAGGDGSVTASCLAGEQFLSGGNDGFFDVFVVASRQSGNGWAVFAHNNSGGNRTITAHVYCLAP